MTIPIGPLLNFEDGLNPRIGSAFVASSSSTSPIDFMPLSSYLDICAYRRLECICNSSSSVQNGFVMHIMRTNRYTSWRSSSVGSTMKTSGDMRHFQIRILHEQAQHLPGSIISKYFSKLELVTGTGVTDSIPTCIVKVEHDGIDLMSIKDEIIDGLIIDKVLQEGDGFAYLKARTPGPIQQIIANEDEAWIMPPTYLSREDGFFMTIHGTADGLKRLKDKLELLVPEKIQMKLSSPTFGNWVSIPELHQKRSLVIKTGIKMGYYASPRRCNQTEIANSFGVSQATVAEHLREAENIIINSWAEQLPSSKSSD